MYCKAGMAIFATSVQDSIRNWITKYGSGLKFQVTLMFFWPMLK